MNNKVTQDEINAAYALISQGRKTDALKAFKSLFARDPKNLNIMNGAGLAFQMNGRHKDALKLFETLLREAGNSPMVLHNIGVSHIELSNLVAAEKAEEQAIQLDNNNYEIMIALATLKIYLRKFDEGKALLSQYIEACPKDGRGYMFMAELVRLQATPQTLYESMKTAVGYAEISYQLNPGRWRGRRLVALCYLHLGKFDKAIMTLVGLWPVRPDRVK